MRVPLGWLKEYVEFEDTVEGFRDRLTFSGLEVEGVETFGAALDPRVVAARILRVERHPNADRLTLCTIDHGAGELRVVCGAPNVREGMVTVFAPSGVTLPGGLTLKKAKIRGVESEGMLCAEDELGLSKDHAGILDLPADTAPGTPAIRIFGEPEVVFDLEVTPNRPDCLSLVGIAREVATLYGKPLRLPAAEITETSEPVTAAASVEVRDPAGCPRYTARVLRDVKIDPSPEWMRRRLTHAGIRPIHNVVDITNYVLIELGHPLHAFDLSLVGGRKIIVRSAGEGEVMNTLDGRERKLDPSVLVIADANRPVAVAGVMGGQDSEIRDTTTDVLLESATFASARVRAASKKLELSTESSHRFARGVDAAGVEFASRRAAALMQQLAGATVARGVIDSRPAPAAPREVGIRWSFLRDLTGVDASAGDALRIFTALGLDVVRHDDQGAVIAIPTFRGDLEREVDLVEEFIRIHGLDRIPVPAPAARIVPGATDGVYAGHRALRELLTGLGLTQATHYSLTAPKLLDLVDPAAAGVRIVLPNPISADQSVLRTSLLPQMVETLGRNKSRQNHEVGLFELGRVFSLRDGAMSERTLLSVGLMGPVGRGPLARRKSPPPGEVFAWARGVVEALGVRGEPALSFRSAAFPCFEAGQSAEILAAGAVIGRIGLLKSSLRQEWRMQDPVALVEIDPAPFIAAAARAPVVGAVPSFPSTSRDAALIVAAGIRHDDILAVVARNRPALLESVSLFDVFEGAPIPEGRRSMVDTLSIAPTAR
ncbi:MAG: phenylalanine--tRNA ligase subunit beta [Kiritimatiellia bacterium]